MAVLTPGHPGVPATRSRVLVLGHGGVRGPHMNTLEAFAQALREGADGFEIDVRLTADRRLVALHDPVFEAGGRAYAVSELTLAEIRRLHPLGGRVATLDEALAQHPEAIVAVDAKTPRAAEEAAALLARESRLGNAILSGDSYRVLAAARRVEPGLRLGYSLVSLRSLAALPFVAAALRVYAVHAPLDGVEVIGLGAYRALLRASRAAGLRVAVWSWRVREEEFLPLLAGLYDVVIADRPGAAARLLEGLGLR